MIASSCYCTCKHSDTNLNKYIHFFFYIPQNIIILLANIYADFPLWKFYLQNFKYYAFSVTKLSV